MYDSIKMKRTQTSTSENVRSFETFLESWLVRQEHFLDELHSTLQTSHESRDDDLRELIGRVLAHYQQYYEEKSRMAHRNVFLVFSPTWFTPFERAFFWIAGYKPALAFRLINNSVTDMSQDQSRRMEQLKEETRLEERELANTMARIQESLAAPPLVEMARMEERSPVNTSIEVLRSELETVLGSADMLRTRTAERVVDVLSPIQNVRFLAAATELQLRIRTWGLQKKGERSHQTTTSTSTFGW